MHMPPYHFPSEYMRPHRVADEMNVYVRPDDAEIAYYIWRTEAARDWLLFLHGNGEDHEVFGPYIDEALRLGKNVIAIDSRGQGKSSLGTSKLSYELMASDTKEVLDALGIKRYHVFGFSDGAILALLLGIEDKASVESIVALGANIEPEGLLPEDQEWIHESIKGYTEWLNYISDSAHAATRNPKLFSPSYEETKRTLALLTLMRDEPHISREALATISAPCTIVAGEFDCISREHTELISSSIATSSLKIIKDGPHNLVKHKVEKLLELMRKLY